MTNERGGSISGVIKERTPISEVAERFSISRPTLYKYMDFYDQGEHDRIPSEILDYFRMMERDNASADESRMYLMSKDLRNRIVHGEADLDEPETRRLVEGFMRLHESKAKGSESDGAWSGGSLRTMSVGQNGRGMVIFADAFESPDWTRVLVSVDMEGRDLVIARYVPEEGMSFVSIDNLLPKLDYRYWVEQGRGTEVAVSEIRTLRLR